jgi:hypothetical protein
MGISWTSPWHPQICPPCSSRGGHSHSAGEGWPLAEACGQGGGVEKTLIIPISDSLSS